MQKKSFFFCFLNKGKSNSTPSVGNRSTQVRAFKHLYLTVNLKVVTHVKYCFSIFPSGGNWQILQKTTNSAKGLEIKIRVGKCFTVKKIFNFTCKALKVLETAFFSSS